MLTNMLRNAAAVHRAQFSMLRRLYAVASSQPQKNREELFDRIIRVDHAGEFGADRIYAGQMAVLTNAKAAKTVKHMWEQEKEHLKMFTELIEKHSARPSALLPMWNIAGFALGAGSALLGEKMAMACTIAVESVIVEHYDAQIRELELEGSEESEELLKIIQKCRDDEEHHHDLGIIHEGMEAPFYAFASGAIKTGCKIAIAIAERI